MASSIGFTGRHLGCTQIIPDNIVESRCIIDYGNLSVGWEGWLVGLGRLYIFSVLASQLEFGLKVG